MADSAYTSLPIWLQIVLVGGAGGIGALCRHYIVVLLRSMNAMMGMGTLVVNSVACLLIGIFAGWLVVSPWSASNKEAFSLLTMVGFCGGFSTFSAFTLDSVKYYEAGQFLTWVVFGTLTVFIGLFACALGYWLGQKM